MDVEYLREYLVVAGELNYTHAARLLNTTQSTLSKHVAALEREFGGELLVRNGKSVELTQAGVALYRRARTIVGEYDAAKAELKKLRRSTSVKVGGMLQNGEVIDLLSKATALIKSQEHPYALLTATVDGASLERLARHEVDVVLCHHTEDAAGDGIAYRKLVRNPFLCIVENNHPLAGRGPVSICDLRDYPFVQLVGDYATMGWRRIQEVCAQYGFAPRKFPIVARNAIDCLTEPLGDAVLILTGSLFPSGLRSYGGLSMVQVDDPLAYFDLCAYYRSGDERRLEGFLEVLDRAAELVQESIDHPVPVAPARPFQARCRRLAQEHGLNETETEAMISFTKGRSLDRIGQEMGLTRTMVGDLLASVYQKCGVCDKQVLLDMIESVKLG